MKKSIFAATLVALSLVALPAMANGRGHGGGHHGGHHGGVRIGIVVPLFHPHYPSYPVYAPPPVYYNPPVYYTPPPVYIERPAPAPADQCSKFETAEWRDVCRAKQQGLTK